MISTATVALQEQLVHKDLPALAKLMPQPFRFALAKGRGRYVCQQKLERLTGMMAEPDDDEDEVEDDLFADDDAAVTARPARPAHEVEARLQFYTGIAQTLSSGALGRRPGHPRHPARCRCLAADGRRRRVLHRQALPVVQPVRLLRTPQDAGRRAGGGGQPRPAAGLASATASLPELDNCLLVLDEAHHLPATALAQFGCRMDLGRHGWVERLAQRAVRVGVRFEVTEVADVPMHAAQMRQALQETERLVMDLYGDGLKSDLAGPAGLPGRGPARARLPLGALPEALQGPLGRVAHHASGFLDALRVIASALRAEMREQPAMARKLATMYAQLGALAPRLEQTLDTAQLLLRDAAPDAVPAGQVVHAAGRRRPGHAAGARQPAAAGATLRHHLWNKVRGAVLTSATLTSCGHFDFFLRESGLHGDEAATTLEVPSPFDYAAQGKLIAVETRADPRDAAGYVAEMVQSLVRDLAEVRRGAGAVHLARPAAPGRRGAARRAQAARAAADRHAAPATARHPSPPRAAEGLPSIVFGMQSFGEGLDLPGKLCESVFIAKLPFAPPDDPVGEARAEWLRTVGRDPFTELVVPATAIRLAQWVGRAIRSEEDRASVYCYDRRLVRTSYGQRLLKGLPPFAFSTVRVDGVVAPDRWRW